MFLSSVRNTSAWMAFSIWTPRLTASLCLFGGGQGPAHIVGAPTNSKKPQTWARDPGMQVANLPSEPQLMSSGSVTITGHPMSGPKKIWNVCEAKRTVSSLMKLCF